MDATQEAPAPAEQSPAAEQQPNFDSTKHKVKIDGREVEVTTDELLRGYSHAQAANKKFQEASQIRSSVDQVLHAFEKGDLSFLKKVVPRDVLLKFSEDALQEYVEHEAMSPEAKKAFALEQRNRELESEKEARERQEKEQELARVQEQTDKQIESEFIDAVKSLGKDAKATPRLLRRIAEQMQATLEASQSDPSIAPISAKRAAERAYRGIKKDFSEFLEHADVQEALELLPRKLRDAIRRADLESVGARIHSGIRNPDKNAPLRLDSPTARSKQKKMTTDQWFDAMGKKLKG